MGVPSLYGPGCILYSQIESWGRNAPGNQKSSRLSTGLGQKRQGPGKRSSENTHLAGFQRPIRNVSGEKWSRLWARTSGEPGDRFVYTLGANSIMVQGKIIS